MPTPSVGGLGDVPAALFALDSRGRFVWVTEFFAILVERPIATIVGAGWEAVVVDADHDSLRRALAAGLSGASRHLEGMFSVRGERNNARPVRCRATFSSTGGCVGVLEDAAEELNTRAELERTLADNEATSRFKRQFLAQMSHEVRTPMNAVIGMAELLAESPLDKEQTQHLEILKKAGDHMLGVIDDVLALTQAEAGRVSLESTDFHLVALVEEAVDLVAARARQKGVELHMQISPDVPARAVGDAPRLRQILVQLLSNAIKFTERGEVVLGVIVDGAAPNIRFAIRDTGPGIVADRAARIFDDLPAVDPASTRPAAGLGLQICRRLVARLGGTITCESEPGRGSTFSFVVPLPAGNRPRSNSGTTWIGLEAKRCLTVIRDLPRRKQVRELLHGRGADLVELASEGQLRGWLLTAPETAPDSVPRLLVLDDSALDSDGTSLLVSIRHQFAVDALGIVWICAEGASADRPGGVVTVERPLKARTLFEAIALALAPSARRRSSSQDIPVNNPSLIDPNSGTPPGLSMLVVDDAEDNRLLIRQLLKSTPHRLTFAADGMAAIDAFRVGRFDVVLMDIQMPVLDGIAATEELRRIEAQRQQVRTPVIALTAHAMPEQVERCMAAGCTSHLAKPIKRQTLFDAIRQVTGGKPIAGADTPRAGMTAATTIPREEPSEPAIDPRLLPLLPMFLDARRRDVTALDEALRNNDLETCRIIGHTMKGLGTSYGFPRVTDIGAELEQAAVARRSDRIRASIAALQTFLRQKRSVLGRAE